MKPFADWLNHLESLHPKGQGGIELGLERVRRVKDELRQTQNHPLIIVGGTNGKGSTCAYLESIYEAAGYRVGCYTSPHLLAYNERVRVGGRAVDDDTLCRAFARVEAARIEAGNVPLTYFEFGTLAAWEVFAAAGVAVTVLEVGLGGRLDAVNVYDADCAVVTGVALDHMDWLGETREAIGHEKAGIFRAGKTALCADPAPPLSLREHAARIGAVLHCHGQAFGASARDSFWAFEQDGREVLSPLPYPVLRGTYQLRNAAVALQAIHVLRERLPVSADFIRRGLVGTFIPGRFQVVPGRPLRVLDVAHNPQAVAVLAENLCALQQGAAGGRTLAVVGMLVDKDISGALAPLSGKIDVWLLADLNVPRGGSAQALQAVVRERGLGGQVACFSSPEEAYERAAKLAGEDDRILTFGSFHTVAAVMRMIGPRV